MKFFLGNILFQKASQSLHMERLWRRNMGFPFLTISFNFMTSSQIFQVSKADIITLSRETFKARMKYRYQNI